MPEMINVRCPRCGKKLLFSPFDNYKKATLECPGCHYTGLVETYPEIPSAPPSQRTSNPSASGIASASSSSSSVNRPSQGDAARGQRSSGIRDLDQANSNSRNNSSPRASSRQQQGQNSGPTGFAVKFPWVISGLALAIIILYLCLQFISTNEVI